MKVVKRLLIVLYVLFILSKTVIGRTTYPEPIFRGLFWEIQQGMWNDIFLNIMLFIPLGFLLGGWKGLVLCFILSCGIEVFQYFSRFGYCELDDILNNTIGSVMGVLLWLLLKKMLFLLGVNKNV